VLTKECFFAQITRIEQCTGYTFPEEQVLAWKSLFKDKYDDEEFIAGVDNLIRHYRTGKPVPSFVYDGIEEWNEGDIEF
jgi:hypothetical protein